MKLTTLRQPSGYYFNGKSASTKFSRTFVVPVVASVAENQQRVQVVLQRAPKSPVSKDETEHRFQIKVAVYKRPLDWSRLQHRLRGWRHHHKRWLTLARLLQRLLLVVNHPLVEKLFLRTVTARKNEQDHHNLQNRFDTNEAAPLGVQQLLSFERKGWLSVRQLFSREEVEHIHKAILPALEERELEALQQRIRVLCPGVDPYAVNCKESAHSILAQKSVEPLGFLQFFNLNKYIPLVKELACSKRLASMAASLLGCDKVRLYQDCVFLKHAGYALTNWHSDLRMTPLDQISL
eukprot:jgi/Botrbrau1/16946/Bobra.49_2s0012.1